MRVLQRRKRKWNYLLLAFLFPFLGMLTVMACSQYHPFGSYSMLYSDMYHQYYPFFAAFRRALLSGDSLAYSWNVGMGMDYPGLIAYYLASPLNLLCIFVPEKYLLDYFSLLVPVKLGLAGLFYALFLKKLFDKEDWSVTVFGAFWGLCAWALGYQWNVMWLDTFALLPLVVLGMVSLIREKKFVLYTVSLFLSVFTNYYIGLFTCIFVFLLFFCMEICRFRGWKAFFGDLLCIAFFSALAIGMTAVLTFSAMTALQTTQSSVNQFPTGFRMNIAKKNTVLGLLDAMRAVAGNMGGSMEPTFKEGLPNLYCGVGTILLGFLYLLSGEVRLRDKLCALGLLLFFSISFIIRQLDYIWHGFHFPNMIPYRFSFLYSFVMLYMAYCAWNYRKKYDIYQIIAAALLTLALLCCSDHVLELKAWELGELTLQIPVYIIYNGGFLLLYLGVLLYGAWRGKQPEAEDEAGLRRIRRQYRRRFRKSSTAFLGAGCLELALILLCFGLYFPGTAVSNYPKGTEEAASMIRYMHEREASGQFYRAETTHAQTLNDGALNNYNGISTFTSSANVRVTEFMKAFGYGAKNTYNRYCFEESSPVANLFLNLKYMIERDGKDRTSSVFSEVHHFGKVYLLKNNAWLPLGFLTEDELAFVDFSETIDPFDLQNKIFSAATGEEGDVWHRIPGENLRLIEEGVTVKDDNGSGYCSYTDSAANGNLIYSYTADRAGFACVNLDLPKRNKFYVSVNGIELYNDTISLPQMTAVADVQPGDIVDIRIVCPKGESGTATLSAAIMDTELYFRGYEHLNASVLHVEHFGNTRVEGTVACNRDGLLYTSIPQNGNWKAIVDGQEADTLLVGDCMLAVPMMEGSHTVSFVYVNKILTLGMGVSLLSAAIFGTVTGLVYFRRKKETDTVPDEPVPPEDTMPSLENNNLLP